MVASSPETPQASASGDAHHTPLRGEQHEIPAIDDITDTEDLVRFAVAAQLGLVKAWHPSVSQNSIERSAYLSTGALTKKLRGDKTNGYRRTPFSDDELRQLDDAFVAVKLEHAGGLSAMGVRLRGRGDTWANLDARVPPGWADEMLAHPSTRELGVMLQATALTARVRAAYRAKRPVNQHHEADIKRTVRQLVHIGSAPPTRRNVEALILLGTLAGYTFAQMQGVLRDELASPLGFRVWRAVTKSVLLAPKNNGATPAADVQHLENFVFDQLQKAEQLREISLYPGRSLDLELAIIVPRSWSEKNEINWVRKVLLDRATNEHATLRERGTAAFGLWQRAVTGDDPDREQVRGHLLKLIDEFQHHAREDIAEGLRWTAITLQRCLDDEMAVCNRWPDADAPWFRVVMDAAASLERQAIPPEVRPGARKLFEHILLQNAGVYRRQAIETLIAAGLAKYVTPALTQVLEREQGEHWLRIRALFALGFMQCRDDQVARALADACNRIYRRLNSTAPADYPPALITELHAALFAIGDCFGPREAADEARNVRNLISTMLRELVTEQKTLSDEMRPIARAIAYLLTVTAQPRTTPMRPDLAQELLMVLKDHTDEVTRKLSEDALNFRFTAQGKIRPLLDADRTDLRDDDDPDDPLGSTWAGWGSNPQ